MSILVLTSDTLIGTPAAGNIEYNGQFFGTDSNASRAQLQRITQGTAVASTSGTSIDFTSLPAWIKRITVMFNGVSTSGTSNVQLQIGLTSPETSGYLSVTSLLSTTSVSTGAAASTGFIVSSSVSAATTMSGIATFATLGSNIWTCVSTLCRSDGINFTQAGNKTASGVIDRIRITTVNGTDTFDAGSINILYEG